MKNIFLLFIVTILSTSCTSYFDSVGFKNDYLEFIPMKRKNVFKQIKTIPDVADKEYYYYYNFEIDLPKKIKTFSTFGRSIIFEYSSEQIILIHYGVKEIVNHGKKIREFSMNEHWNFKDFYYDDDSRDYTYSSQIDFDLYTYWDDKGYNVNYLEEEQNSKRISKLYTDGNSTIVLYNIKKKNIKKYQNKIKSFRYLRDSNL